MTAVALKPGFLNIMEHLLKAFFIEQDMYFTGGLHVVGLFLLQAEACSYYERAPHRM